ncbi:hypothetical protein D9758_004272 [Tetrapyrgos nigripes]|uniref:Uncharacterized protein n=1 Tax=Tetrapyrgos nigripes TaxID=182062 RepID=A0A8H5GTY6_9AGAR|nr:hypothetical protein D9758_004272 [Tetrapyrgos nigripes]
MSVCRHLLAWMLVPSLCVFQTRPSGDEFYSRSIKEDPVRLEFHDANASGMTHLCSTRRYPRSQCHSRVDYPKFLSDASCVFSDWETTMANLGSLYLPMASASIARDEHLVRRDVRRVILVQAPWILPIVFTISARESSSVITTGVLEISTFGSGNNQISSTLTLFATDPANVLESLRFPKGAVPMSRLSSSEALPRIRLAASVSDFDMGFQRTGRSLKGEEEVFGPPAAIKYRSIRVKHVNDASTSSGTSSGSTIFSTETVNAEWTRFLSLLRCPSSAALIQSLANTSVTLPCRFPLHRHAFEDGDQ